ncbi:site-specific DNA-methyltransferase [Mycoplasma sp. VS30B]
MNNDKKQIILDWLKEQEETETLTQKQRDVYALIRESLHSKKYGLVFEKKEEDIVNKTNDSILTLEKKYSIILDTNKKLNYLIEGDNYQSLKLLLKTHRNRIDVIYIDPPYNTGNKDFTYNDQYVDSEDTFRHSKWLSFMKRRLELAKELLSEKGVIFISIDDNEQSQLKLLCDEIFGENNFISCMPRKTVSHIRTNADYQMQNLNDYVLLYSKNKEKLCLNKEITGEKEFDFEDEFGKYLLKPFQNSGANGTREARPNLYYPIFYSEKHKSFSLNKEDQSFIEILPSKVKNKDGRWLWKKETFLERKNELHFYKNKIYRKEYLGVSSDVNKYSSYKNWIDTFPNSLGANALKKLALQSMFDYSKPVELIIWLINLIKNKNAIILDFFTGSGTTGHAVAKLNAEDGGDRIYILCTNNENNICEDVTFKRLSNIQEELPHNLIYQKVNSINKSDFIYSYYGKEYLDKLDVSSLQLAQLQLGKLIDNKELLYFENQEEFNNYSVDDLLDAKFIFINENKIDLNECEVYDQIKNKVISIPNAYYEKELKEVGYLW